MQHKTDRGAALVSLAWVLVLLVLFLGAVGLGIYQAQEAGRINQELQSETQARKQAEDEKTAVENQMRELGSVVGYNKEPQAPPSKTTIEAALTQVQSDIEEVGADAATLQVVVNRMAELYQTKEFALNKKEEDYKRIASELETAKAASEDVAQEKENMLQDLRKQNDDLQAQATAERGTQEKRITNLQEQNRQLDDQNRALQSQMVEEGNKANNQITLLEARIKEFQKKFDIIKEPDAPKGRILSVSDKLDLAYIDKGARNRVRRGMRFQVSAADFNNSEQVKGVVEVIEVNPEYAAVKIVESADRFDPISQGDYIMNPLFDPSGNKRAVLVGRFSGRFEKEEISALLQDIGIQVQNQVDITTDYLILGYEEIVNGEPVPFEQNEQYKKASTLGVSIFPLKRIESFFAY